MLRFLLEAWTRGRCVSIGMPDLAAMVLNGRSSIHSTNSNPSLVHRLSSRIQVQVSFCIGNAKIVISSKEAP
jgi:hypothetical protein